MKAPERTRLETAKRASVGQLLMKSARLFNKQALARLRVQTGMRVREAHTTLFPHIDLEGTRLTTLATRVGTSKQAVAQLVDELVEMGALERTTDPNDGRAKLIRFARRRGRLSLFDGLDVLSQIESEYRHAIGHEVMDQLHVALVALSAELEHSAMLEQSQGLERAAELGATELADDARTAAKTEGAAAEERVDGCE